MRAGLLPRPGLQQLVVTEQDVLNHHLWLRLNSNLMGEQTILCGVLQAASILCFDKMVQSGVDKAYACKLIQFGWETICEALKQGGITHMMDRLSNKAKLRHSILPKSKEIMTDLYLKHMDDIESGEFSCVMMEDWANDDVKLHTWRENFAKSDFENAPECGCRILREQEYLTRAFYWLPSARPALS